MNLINKKLKEITFQMIFINYFSLKLNPICFKINLVLHHNSIINISIHNNKKKNHFIASE